MLDDNSRVFEAAAALTIHGLTLTGGRGGAVSSSAGTLLITDSAVIGNRAEIGGGGLSGNSVRISNSVIAKNYAKYGLGGGVSGNYVYVVDSSIEGNSTGQVTVDLPASTQLLTPRNYMNNGATAAAVAYDSTGIYIETDF